MLHSDAGRRRGASDKVSKHPFYVDGPTFGNRIRVELLFLLVACVQASLVSIVHHAMRGCSALHIEDAVLNRRPTTHRFGRTESEGRA